MNAWLSAALVAAVIGAIAPGALMHQAWSRGWFERSSRTSRGRRDRRVTTGGPVLVVATVLGVMATGEGGAPARAAVVAGLILLVTGWRAERAHGSEWLVIVGRVGAAVGISATGLRIHATGVDAVDAVFTAAASLAIIGAFAGLDDQDGAGTAIAGATATAVTAIALLGDQTQVAVVAAALLGACAGLLLYMLPPATATLGRTGGAFAGAVIAIGAVGIDPPISAPQSIAIPVLLVALPVLGAAAAVIGKARRAQSGRAIYLDRRLRMRGFRPSGVVAIAAGAQAALGALAFATADGRLGWATAIAIGAAIVAVVLMLAFARSAHRHPVTGLPLSLRLAAIIGVLLFGAVVTVTGVAALRARSHLEAGRSAAEDGLDAARDGDVDRAHRFFASAREQFDQADSLLASPLVTAGLLVPVVAQNLDAVRTVTDVGLDLSDTGEQLAARAGADEIRVRDGVLPVAQTRTIAADLGRALGTVDESAAALRLSNSPFLASPVTRAIDTLNSKIERVRGEVTTVRDAAAVAPGLFGGDGPRRYFLVVQTPDELRGSGGLMGSFGEITAVDGKLELPRLERTTVLNGATDPARQAALLPAVYRSRYGGFAPDRFWQNITAPADFPTAAQAIEAAYPATAGGQPVDGVIAVDPIGLAALLKVTGPVSVEGWPDPIGPDNAERVLLFDQYVTLEGETREGFLGDVADAVFDRLTTGELDAPSEIVDALAPAVAAGHIRLHSTRADEQRLFSDIDAAGALPPLDQDSLTLATQNGSESKIDYYLSRSLSYEPRVDLVTGQVIAKATITLRNDAPSSGVDTYMIGGDRGGPTAPGDNRLFATFYSPLSLERATLDGNEITTNTGQEAGLNAYTVLTTIPAGTAATLVLELRGIVPAGHDYVAHVGLQPTVNPDHVTVTVTELGGAPFVLDGARQDTRWEGDLSEPFRISAHTPRIE